MAPLHPKTISIAHRSEGAPRAGEQPTAFGLNDEEQVPGNQSICRFPRDDPIGR